MSSGQGTSTEQEGDSLLAFLRELPVLLLVAFLLAFLLRTFVLQVFFIPSGSMEPTLQEQDRIVVEKLTYLVREPQRGEVIVFAGDDPVEAPDEGTWSRITRGVGQFLGLVPVDAQDFVKRVIGLPGDTVLIDDGVVYVNGTAIDEPYVVNEDDRSSGPFEVPPGELFVLGDNRPNSSDSRFGLGFVEVEDVVGRAAFVLWPPDHFGGLETFGVDELDLDEQGPGPPDGDAPEDDPNALGPVGSGERGTADGEPAVVGR